MSRACYTFWKLVWLWHTLTYLEISLFLRSCCVITHNQSLIPQREGIFLESESLNSLKNTQTFIELEVYFLKESQPLDPVLGKESVQAWSQFSLKNNNSLCLSIHKDIQHTKNYSPYLKAVSSICILIMQFVVVTSYSKLHARNPSHIPNPWLLELCNPLLHKSHLLWWHLILSM
jgi:hypothetical protein